MMEISLPVIGIIVIALFLILTFLGMHVGFAMMLAGFLGIIVTRGLPAAYSTIATVTYKVGTSEYLAIIPLFILMGVLAGSGNISRDAFATFHKWLGHLRGGLAMAAVGACTAFGAVCGNNVATAATIAKVAQPHMKKYGYSDQLSVSAIAAGGGLGILIPPSGTFIVYGFVTETPIGSLFVAGILPGLILCILFMVTIYILVRIKPSLAETAPPASWKERFKSLKGLVGIGIVFVIVMGGLLRGFFTPSEAGGVAVIAIVLVNLIYRQFNLKLLGKSLLESAKMAAMIMALIIGATVLSTFLTTSELSLAIAENIRNANLNPYVLMGLVIFMYIFTGCIMDIWAVLIVTLPIFFPLILDAGFDPLQFGVLSILCVIIGSVTPPVGIVVYALSGMLKDVHLDEIFKGVVPFVLTMVVFAIILMFIPEISTFLPSILVG